MKIMLLWWFILIAISVAKFNPVRATLENDLKIIKQKLVDIDAKMNLIANLKLKQIQDNINQINGKLEQSNNNYNKLFNMMQNSKTVDGSIITDRMKMLEDGLAHINAKIGILGNVDSKIDNIKADVNEITINSRLLSSKPVPESTGVDKTEIFTQIDALSHKMNSIGHVQDDINSKLDSCSTIQTPINTLNKSNENSDSKPTVPQAPQQLVFPPSSMENILVQFLEAANIAVDDSLSPQSLIDSGQHDKKRFRSPVNNNNKQIQTVGLLKQLWKKFTRPIYNLSKSVDDLRKNGLKDFGLCEKSINQLNRLETVIVSHFDTISQSLRPSFNFCENILKKLESLSINSDAQFNNLDQRIFYHISLSEKMFDKLTNSIFVTNEASVDKSFADVKSSDCAELQEIGVTTTNGIYTININNQEKEVYCDFSSHGGGWTVIQRRDYYPDQQENFNRKWEEYKSGFGAVDREFWFGNDDLHWMTTSKDFILLVELKDFSGNYAFAFYNTFRVDPEESFYRLSVGEYNGNASDSLAAHNKKLFSTIDKINDEVDPCCSCAITFEGGWWFYACFESHLNGPYMKNPTDNGYFRGIIWEHWKGDYSLKACEMKIRPKNYQTSPTTRKNSRNDNDSDDYAYPDP